MRKQSFDAIVVGGGFAGLVTAASLAEQGIDVLIVEPRLHAADRSLLGELLHPYAVRGLEILGLEAPIRKAGAVPIEGFAVRDPSTSEFVLLPYSDRFGLALEHSDIITAMRRAMAGRPRISFHEGRVSGLVIRDGVVTGVTCADDSTFDASLVVIADGRNSKLRSQAGIEVESTLPSHMIATTIDASALPEGPQGHVFVGGPGPVLAYPIGHGIARINVDVPVGAPKGRQALVEHVAANYGRHVPPDLFAKIVEGFRTQPMLGAANHVIISNTSVAPGAVVMGDAAGCSHPLAATGMSCAVSNAENLAACIRKHGLGAKALEVYDRSHYDFIRPREAFAKAIYEVLLGADAPMRVLRDGMFRYWNDERARRASMAILAAEESRARALVLEFALVVGASAMAIAKIDEARQAPKSTRALAQGTRRLVDAGTWAFFRSRKRPSVRPAPTGQLAS